MKISFQTHSTGCVKRKILLAAILFFTLCNQCPSAKGYWIWAGISASDIAAKNSDSVYIYQGLVSSDGAEIKFSKKGLYHFPLKFDKAYLALRLDNKTLPPTDKLSQLSLNLIRQWEKHGVKIIGIQIDYDSPTFALEKYEKFLKSYRSFLPSSYRISITALADWIHNPSALQKISNTTQEIVFQLYQERKMLDPISTYLDQLSALKIPFKVGVLASADCRLIDGKLTSNKNFYGSIVFVQK